MANIFSDALTATSGTLQTYDAAWEKHPNATGNLSFISSARLVAGVGTGLYTHNTTDLSNQKVEVDVYSGGSSNGQAGVVARCSTTTQTFYNARFNNGNVQLFKAVAATFTQLGADYAQAITAGTSKRLGLICDGNQISVTVDGAVVIGPVTDASIASGRAGLRSASAQGNYELDNFSVDNLAASDTTAPTLTSPSATATGATTASGSVTTDEANGTLYWLASGNASEAVATVKAGSSQAVSASGVQNVTVTGLTASTPYYLHFVHTDAAANDSTVATSAQFTTAATNTSPSFTGPNIADISGTESVALTPVDVSSLFFDSESGLTFSAVGSWPAGVTVSSAGVISGTPTTAGTYSGLQVRATDAGALTADSNAFTITVAAPLAAGINVTDPLKNNTGTVLASQSGVRVAVLQAADLVSVYEATGLTTNASGILTTISDTAIIPGQQYHVVIKLADGSVGITGPITAS